METVEAGARATGGGRIGPTAAALVAATALAAVVPAQTVRDKLELTRQSVETQRRVLVSGALPLTDDEARDFWPLYDDYEKQRREIDERENRLVADFVAASANLSDTQARVMLEEALQVEEARLKLKRTYRDRMARAIPPRKLMRFFQIENKLDAVVRADVSRQIPLAP